MKSILMTLAAMTALALGATGAFADESTKPFDAQPAPRMAKPLTIDDLGAMLDAMGLLPSPLKDKDGKVVAYRIELEQGGWTIRMKVALSKDGSNLWFTAGFRVVDSKEAVPGLVLVKLLQQSERFWPAYFAASDDGMVYITMPAANADLTPAKMRKHVAVLAEAIRELVPLLDPANWPKNGSSTNMPAPAPAPAPKG
jgi:hypothetical protein